MADYQYFANVTDLLAEITPDSIISRIIYKDEQINVTLFGFAAGQALSEHSASQAAIIQILQGEALITLGGDAQEANAGAWIHMPPRLEHSITARTTLVMLLTLIK